MDGTDEPYFHERTRPQWLLLLSLFVIVVILAEALSLFGADWWRSVLLGALLSAGFSIYIVLVVVQVREGSVSWARRSGGPHVPIAQLVAIRVLTGPALRECRKRLTPSLRLHCPVWERTGVQLVVAQQQERREYLVAVRDMSGFLAAIGRPELVTEHDEAPVPV